MTLPDLGPLIPRIGVHDFEASLAFYRDVLGFRAEVLWPEDAPSFGLLRNGEARLGLTSADHLEPGGAELYIEAPDVAGLHRRLIALGIPIEWGPEIYSYGRREFAIRDPAGHLVIFTQDTSEAPTSPEPHAG